MVLFLGNNFILPGKETHTALQNLEIILLDKPGIEFCSCIKIGIFNFFAALHTGKVIYPPTPINISGLNLSSISYALLIAFLYVLNTLIFLNIFFLF